MPSALASWCDGSSARRWQSGQLPPAGERQKGMVPSADMGNAIVCPRSLAIDWIQCKNNHGYNATKCDDSLSLSLLSLLLHSLSLSLLSLHHLSLSLLHPPSLFPSPPLSLSLPSISPSPLSLSLSLLSLLHHSLSLFLSLSLKDRDTETHTERQRVCLSVCLSV